MTDPQQPQVPPDAPEDVRKFFDCTGTKMEWKPGKVTWLGLPVDPDVEFEHGAAPGTINLKITVGMPPLAGVTFTLPASVNASGELTVDTSSVPDLSGISDQLPGRQSIDDAIKNLNDWFKKNGYKLKPAVFKKGVVTLEKTAIGAAPVPAGVVPGAGGKTEPVKPTTPPPPPAPPPVMGTPPQKEPGGGCSLLGMLMLLLFLGVVALGGGIGFVFLGGQPPGPSATAVAVATASPSPAPTASPTIELTASPTASPTESAAATPSPAQTASPSATATPSPAAVGEITAVCVRVYHDELEDFLSFLDWFIWWTGDDVDSFEITVLGANNDESVLLEYSPVLGAWRAQLGLMEPGEKQITSLVAHMTNGQTVDLTPELIGAFGSEEFTVRFPQQDSFGDCPGSSFSARRAGRLVAHWER